MRLGCRAVDHVDVAGALLRQRRKQTPPDAARRPAVKAVVDRGRRTITLRTVLPATASLQDMNDAANNPPIVLAMRAGLMGW